MIQKEKTKDIITSMAKIFLDHENLMWSNIDEYMLILEHLNISQLVKEASVILEEHATKNVECYLNNSKSDNLAPKILHTVSLILRTFKNTKKMNKNSKYILQYYLALNQSGFIH